LVHRIIILREHLAAARTVRPGTRKLASHAMAGRGQWGGARPGGGRPPSAPSAEELKLAEQRAATKRQREAEDAEFAAKEAAAKQARLAAEAQAEEERRKVRNPTAAPCWLPRAPKRPIKNKLATSAPFSITVWFLLPRAPRGKAAAPCC
jgi:hypothetical protein